MPDVVRGTAGLMGPSLNGNHSVVEVRLADAVSLYAVCDARLQDTRDLAGDRGAVVGNGMAACRHLLMGEQGA